ncbi:MAG: 3-isopropylmalate dehydratase small subunit [Methanomicrobiales archaeon]|nr:3-isopropylmalate dehydratase small subunit [Methanomicrobiales archaeon]MDD1662274.1 3-isopropylmalate dehydratase small subunit [Methanomicrobiales archaeon]
MARKARAKSGRNAVQATQGLLTGRVWRFGNDVDTDAIIPGRFLTLYDPRELAKHAFEGTRDDFAGGAQEGDLIVAGRNFGCGSSREHAPLALKGAGIRIIVARSFARIFYRNAINSGMLPLVCVAAGEIRDGQTAELDLERGILTVEGKRYELEPVPAFLREIVDAGGLVEYARGLSEVTTCREATL